MYLFNQKSDFLPQVKLNMVLSTPIHPLHDHPNFIPVEQKSTDAREVEVPAAGAG